MQEKIKYEILQLPNGKEILEFLDNNCDSTEDKLIILKNIYDKIDRDEKIDKLLDEK